MKKLIQNKLRLWLIILFSCMSSYGYAADVKIEGYNSVGEILGYPFFEITSSSIRISSTGGQFDSAYIDDTQVAYNISSYWTSFILNITSYMDGNIHKLQLKKSSSDYGTCYFSSDTFIEGLFYIVSGETAYVAYANRDIETANILSEYEYNDVKYPVTSIGESAFSGCSELTSVSIPNSVTTIGNYAFNGCTAIKEVTIEDGDETLSMGYNYDSYSNRKGLFYDCPFEKLYLGRNLTYNTSSSYGYSPFYGKTSLTQLTIGNSVTSIGSWAFSRCSGLTSVTIPNSVTTIGNYAFNGCTAIKEITIEDGDETLSMGYNYDSYSNGKGLFYDCPLEKIYLGRDLTYNISYGYSPFHGKTSLTRLTIGNSVTSVGNYAFSGCSGLTSVTIPNSVTLIGNYAFNGCTAIKEITIEDGEGTLSLGYNGSNNGLFYDCPFEKLYLGRNLTYNTGSSYGYSPFYGKTSLTELSIGNSVTLIDESAFSGCSGLTSVAIGSSVTTIGSSAFSGCSGLTSVTIPNSVTTIGNYAFNGCTAVKEITFEDGEETLSLGCNGSNKGLFYDCPIEKLYLGRNLTYNTSSSYGYSPFYGKTNLTELTIGSSVTSLPAYLLRGYSELNSITITNSVTSIGESAFSGCRGLTSVTIPNSVTSIGESAFSGCSGLTSVSIPNSVTTIGNYAFEGCSAIKEITIEDGDETLSLGYNDSSKGLFYDSPLEKLYLGRNLSYSSSPFYGKATLKNLILGQAVSEIGSNCFSNCSSLKEFRTKSYNIGDLANSGLSAEQVLAIIIPDELNEDVANNISQTNLTYFNNVIVEVNENAYSLVTAPNYVDINVCAVKNATIQLIPIENEAVAKADAKSIVNAYFRGNDIMSELYDSGFKFTPTSVWKENIFDIYANSNAGGDYRHVTMKQAGSLFDELGLQDIQSLKHLKITGDINGTDVMTINRMSALKYLDLTDADIVEGGVTYRENLKTENDVVGSYFFYNIALETVLLPETAKKIDNSAFRNSPELKNIEIGKSVTSIGDNAFYNCKSLNRINIPALVTLINSYAFTGCSSLEYLFFEDSPKTLDIGSTFSGIKLKSIYFGRNISSKYYSSYYYEYYTPFSNNEYLKSIAFGETVTNLESSSFEGCSGLTSVILPENITEVSSSLFENCTGLQTVVIHDLVKTINSRAFYNTALHELTIGDAVEDIYSHAFYNTALVEVNLPASVTFIGESCFGNTPTITKVVSLNTTPPEIKSSTFDSEVEEKAMLHVPKGSLVHYWLDPVWKEFGNMSDDILCLDVIPDATYGDPEIDLSQFAPEGVELVYETSNSDVVVINGTKMQIVGAGEATVGAILADEGSQMQLMGQMRQFKVNKADLSVTVADITIAQGQPLPDFSYMVEGLVYDDIIDDIETMPQPLCDVTEDSAPGEYAVEFTEGRDRNYDITTKAAKVTVTAAEPPVSNIDDIDADSDDEIEVYDMKGIRLYKGPRSEARLAKGFYLVRQGNTVAKVYID